MPLPVDARHLLDHLAGSWTLTGTMGSAPLHQSVEAGLVLGGQFLRIHYRQTDDPRPGWPRYEALAFVGWNADAGRWVMTLMDVFGGGFAETVGRGTPDDDAIRFTFDYPDGPLHNTFRYDSQADVWTMELVHQTEAGEWETFATKRLERVG